MSANVSTRHEQVFYIYIFMVIVMPTSCILCIRIPKVVALKNDRSERPPLPLLALQ